jgi:hypothetical protein
VSAPPIPSAPADLELIAQLKSRLQYAELKIRVLEERLRLMQIENFGEHPADILGARDVSLDDQTVGPSFPHLHSRIVSSSLILPISDIEDSAQQQFGRG